MQVRFVEKSTIVPFICLDHYYSIDFDGKMDFERKYYRLNPKLWLSIRKRYR